MSMNIDLSRVREIRSEIDAINAVPFSELVITDDGVPVQISDAVKDGVKYLCLSNFSVLEMLPVEITTTKGPANE